MVLLNAPDTCEIFRNRLASISNILVCRSCYLAVVKIGLLNNLFVKVDFITSRRNT
jgi:hypothetical protein